MAFKEIPLLAQTDDEAPCKCCNCSWKGKASDLGILSHRYTSQMVAGDVLPAGECPECGVPVYAMSEEEQLEHHYKDSIRFAQSK